MAQAARLADGVQRPGTLLRAVLRADLPRELGRAGLSHELGERVAALLDACGQLRFATTDSALARAVLGNAEGLIKELVGRAPGARPDEEQRA
jgi:hypothetical protein